MEIDAARSDLISHAESVQRVIVLGRGGAGKSVFASELSQITNLPAIELDGEFWIDGLNPMPAEQWRARQEQLAAEPTWIMDGDLGPHDVVEPRFSRADTVVVLDFPAALCAWRAWRRGPEQPEFWRWMRRWRRDSWPVIKQQLAEFAPGANVVMLRSRGDVRRFLVTAT